MSEQDQQLERSRSIWFTAIGVVGLILVFLVGPGFADSDFKLLKEFAPTVMWSGIALQIFYMLLFVGNSSLAKLLGGQLASQVTFAVLVWFLFTQASVSASSSINNVFGVSDSAFPITQQVLTFIYLFVFGKPLFVVLLVWGGATLLYYGVSGENKNKSYQAAIFAASGLIIGLLSILIITFNFNEELMPKKVYLIARALDFNDRLNCPGTTLIGHGVFLGDSQNRVLFDALEQSFSWLEAVYANRVQLEGTSIPDQFPIYECKNTMIK